MVGNGSKAALSLAAVSLLCACSHGDPDHPDTGGVTLGQGLCGGVTVVSIDSSYVASSVAVIGFDGAVLSKSIVSSASTDVGLSAAFGGDVVTPTTPTGSPSFLLIDRTPAAVLTWIDAKAGEVTGQLSVLTGYAANPQDYVEVSPIKGYVSRLDDNPDPGKTSFDGGGDVLILDPTVPAITGRIDLHFLFADRSVEPRPNRMVLVGKTLYVLCAGLTSSFAATGDSVLAAIDVESDTVVDSLTLDDSRDCTGLALSPDGSKLAVECSGDHVGNDFDTEHSAVVFVDITSGLQSSSRVAATTLGDRALGFTVAFASDDRVLLTTMGDDAASPPVPDRLVTTTLDGSSHRIVLERGAVKLGDVLCQPSCGACFVADADEKVVQRFPIVDGDLGEPTAIAIDDDPGRIPPRYLGSIGSP